MVADVRVGLSSGQKPVILPVERLDRVLNHVNLAALEQRQGTIIAAGNGKSNDDGKRVPLDVKAGDLTS